MGFLRRLWPLLLGTRELVPEDEDMSFVEIFAGDRSVSRSLQFLGYRGKSFDQRYTDNHNFLSPQGFLAVLTTLQQLHPGAIFWSAPPCSTWVWVSRSSTKRSREDVLGNESSEYIKSQNHLVTRLVYLLALADRLGVYWIIEQPQSSLMFRHPVMERFLKRPHRRVYTVNMHMGIYSLDAVKPTLLVGTAPYLPSLEVRLTHSELLAVQMNEDRLVTSTSQVDPVSGVKRVTGGRDLKKTQSYPLGFGSAHALAFHKSTMKDARRVQLAELNPSDTESDGLEGDESLQDIFGGRVFHSNRCGEQKLALLEEHPLRKVRLGV